MSLKIPVKPLLHSVFSLTARNTKPQIKQHTKWPQQIFGNSKQIS